MESINKKLKEELVEGKEYAKQLQELLLKPYGDDESVLAKEFVEKIVRTFTNSLTEANSLNGMCQIGGLGGEGGGARSGRSFQDSGESRRPEVVKYQRGCYKRRRAAELGVKVTATMEDGYAWRKYGQKEILNSKYRRCYFRCTHKHDRGCQATKQVQRVDHAVDIKYQTTYFGNHTCKTTAAPQIILDDYSDSMNNNCFNHKHPVDHHHSSQLATTAPEETKEFKKGRMTQCGGDATDNKSSSGSTMWQDLIGPGSPSIGSYDPADLEVASSLYSSGSTSLYGLDMKTLGGFSDFDNHVFLFNFDEKNA